jgi:hypothetical protein
MLLVDARFNQARSWLAEFQAGHPKTFSSVAVMQVRHQPTNVRCEKFSTSSGVPLLDASEFPCMVGQRRGMAQTRHLTWMRVVENSLLWCHTRHESQCRPPLECLASQVPIPSSAFFQCDDPPLSSQGSMSSSAFIQCDVPPLSSQGSISSSFDPSQFLRLDLAATPVAAR